MAMAVAALALLTVVALVCAPPAAAELPRLEHAVAKNDGSLSLLVVGDWGRKGTYNQSRVAEQMGRVGEELNIDFVISTGDNFYDDGLTGVDDPAFEQSFTHILYIYDWRGVTPRQKYIDNLLEVLDEAMKKSTAKWKIAVGHHTIRTVSHHGDTVELLQLLLPILKVNGIDFYINGHDHCLEHISSRDSPIQYFTSGGGSKAWRGFFQPNEDKLEFFYDGQGFMSLQLDQDKADFTFYDVDGNILYQYSQWSLRKTYLLQHPSYLTEE